MRNFLLASSALMSATWALPAYAQTAEEAVDDSGEIVVTARKREENLIDVPLPITVATRAQLERDQIYNLNDLPRITPALELSQTSGGETNGGGRLRGLGTGVFNPSVSSSVALVVDQSPVGNLAFPLLYDLAQVEVLRGPQGTLFGQGASAGVLNIATVAPSTEKIGVSASIDFANKGTAGSEVGELTMNGAFNLPLSDWAAIRFATQYKRESGLQRSSTTGRNNVIKDYGLRLKALLEPNDRLTINLSGEYAKNKSAGQTFFAIAIAPNSTVPFGPPGGTLGGLSNAAYLNPTGCAMPAITERAEHYCEALPSAIDLRLSALSAVIDFEVSDSLSFTSVTSYRERIFKQFSRDFSRISSAASARQERTREDSTSFSQELRANYSNDTFDIIVGGFYTDYKFDRTPIGGPPFTFGVNAQGSRIGFSVCPASGVGFCPVPASFTDEFTKNRTYAAFTDATIKIDESFEVFGGLRYNNYANTTRVLVYRATQGPALTLPIKDKNLSGRVGVSYKPNAKSNIFASYSKGYKPNAVGTTAAGALFNLDPEVSDAFELGAKFGIGPVQLAANAFHTRIKDFQSQTSVFAGTALVSEPLNVPSVKSKGFEVTAFGRVLPGLNVNAGYQFNVVKYPAGFLGDDSTAAVPRPIGGTQFLFAPRHKFTISGEYATEVSDSIEIFANANLVYKSKVLLAARADPRFRYPAHEIINVGLGLRHPDGDWNASIFVRNLTKEREPTAYLASTFAGQPDGGIRAWPVAGFTARVVGARLGFQF